MGHNVYYQDDAVTIYHGNAAELLLAMPSNSVDLVLTDPPFNARVKYGSYDDNRPWPDYVAWLVPMIEEMERVSCGMVLVFASVPSMLRLVPAKPPKWVASWNRPVSNNHPAGNSGFMSRWEPCLVYGRTYGADGRVPSFHLNDSWSAMPTGADISGHPCPKPDALMRLILDQHPARTILDPFMGRGTTLRAAKDLGRKAIGIEIEERYCEIAAKRMSQSVFPMGIT